MRGRRGVGDLAALERGAVDVAGPEHVVVGDLRLGRAVLDVLLARRHLCRYWRLKLGGCVELADGWGASFLDRQHHTYIVHHTVLYLGF